MILAIRKQIHINSGFGSSHDIVILSPNMRESGFINSCSNLVSKSTNKLALNFELRCDRGQNWIILKNQRATLPTFELVGPNWNSMKLKWSKVYFSPFPFVFCSSVLHIAYNLSFCFKLYSIICNLKPYYLVFAQDPGTKPAKRIWSSINVGTEIYVSSNRETAEWSVSDFDVLVPASDVSDNKNWSCQWFL